MVTDMSRRNGNPQDQPASRRIQALAGMADLPPKAHKRRAAAIADLQAHFAAAGYDPIDTPLIESAELFVRKTGGELAGKIYAFADPGGNPVSLRPEFTSSVIRHFIDTRSRLSPPVRWQYAGPVFRYEPAAPGACRQFTQSGAELVGASGVAADAEIISLAESGIRSLGVNRPRLRVGHLGVMRDLLAQFGLSEQANLFIIGNIHALKRAQADVPALIARAREVGLLRPPADPGLENALQSVSVEAAEDFILSALKESMPAPVGRRSAESIIARMLRKVRHADAPDAFERALRFADRLAQIADAPQAALAAASAAAADFAISDRPLSEISALIDALTATGIPQSQITLDMRMARGFSYYTGVIFELMPPHTPNADPENAPDSATDSAPITPEPLGGGGRYDDLVQALGGDEPMPAMGFAYNLDKILDAIETLAPTALAPDAAPNPHPEPARAASETTP